MTEGQFPKSNVRALITQFYRDEVEPLEKSILKLPLKKLEMHPVYFVLCRAYFERWRIMRDAAEASIDGQVFVDDKVWEEVQEVSPWVLPKRSASADEAHGTPLGTYLEQAGLDYSASHRTIEEARKARRGRPANHEAAIMALELEIAGKSPKQIAEFLEKSFPSAGYEDATHRIDRVRKLIDTVKPLYEKYRPRN